MEITKTAALMAAIALFAGGIMPVSAEEGTNQNAPTAPHLGAGKLALSVPSDAQNAESSVSAESTSYSAPAYSYNGAVLTPSAGRIYGPSGAETYYNLDMSGVVANTKTAGIEGDYWVRDDGVKMYGNYVIAACDVTGLVHNRYDVVDSSLGQALCMDTGTFAYSDPYQLDIAVTW